LSGSWGEFRVGRQDSVVFQTMADFDFNGASNGVSAGAYSGIGVFARGRQSGVLNYIAPSMGGVTAQFGYQPKGNRGVGAKDVLSAGVRYASGPIALGAAYESKHANGEKDFVSVAGSYDFGAAKVMAGYTDAGSIAAGGSGKGYTLGVQAPVAGFTVGAIYANNTDSLAEIKSYELFLNKELFKNTYGYVEGGNWKSGSTKFSGYALGLIFVF
ncbi:MAG TPA: porin, partial [Burkholderiaceae bacterium]|nr:porin [Burkholderiaceae bacterium]